MGAVTLMSGRVIDKDSQFSSTDHLEHMDQSDGWSSAPDMCLTLSCAAAAAPDIVKHLSGIEEHQTIVTFAVEMTEKSKSDWFWLLL